MIGVHHVADDPLIPDWTSLDNHPPETANGIREILRKLAARGKNRLSMLIIGMYGIPLSVLGQ